MILCERVIDKWYNNANGGNRYNGDTTTVICSSLCVSRDTNDSSMAPMRPIIIPHDSRGYPGICGRLHLSVVNKSDPSKIKCFRAGLFSVNQNFRWFYCFFFLPNNCLLDLSAGTQEIAIFVTIVVSLEGSRRYKTFGACHY